MKRLLLILFLLPVFAHHTASAQGWKWGKVANGESEGYYCTTDASGNIYGTGNHWNTISFGAYTVTGAGAYVVKYDSSGNVKWAISTNATASTSGSLGITTDLFGNEYLLGMHNATITFGGYTLTNPGTGSNFYFIAKIDSSGNVEWIKNIGNVAGYFIQETGNIATDEEGNIYVNCTFINNPTIGSYSFINTDPSNITSDMLVAKFDSSGSVLWARKYGGNKYELPMGIAITPSHNIYITGYYNSDTLSFGATPLPDTGFVLGYYGLFLAKLDSTGNPIWAHGTGGSSLTEFFTGLVSNSTEDVFVTGTYYGTTLTIGSFVLPHPPNAYYGFLAKYDSSGAVAWVKLMQGRYIIPWVPTIDPCGNIWIVSDMGTGAHVVSNDTIDGHILAPLAINGEPNFIACWSNSGTFITASALSSGSTDDPNGLAIDRCGNVYVIADQEECDTMIIATDTFLYSGERMFIAKYNPNIGCGNCFTSLVKDPTSNSGIIIYPNPATTSLTISAPANITSLTIINLLGRTVYTNQYNSQQVQVHVADLPAGIYFVKVNGVEIRKFVKQ
jgi:hypothetical protein